MVEAVERRERLETPSSGAAKNEALAERGPRPSRTRTNGSVIRRKPVSSSPDRLDETR
jgi:hypothetical protein